MNDVVFKSVVRVGGEVTYRLELTERGRQVPREQPGGGDRRRARAPAGLYVEGSPERRLPSSTALERQGFDVDVRAPVVVPRLFARARALRFLILSDTPAEQVSLNSQELIESYLRELGGGFIFAGGPNGYGPGGWYHTTIERILPVRMDAERRKDMPSVAMSLVIDRSGSMTGLPLEMAKQRREATVDTLSPDDLIEVMAFDSTPTRYVKMQPARNRSQDRERHRAHPGRRRDRDLSGAQRRLPRSLGGSGAQEARHSAHRRARLIERHSRSGAGDGGRVDHRHHGRPRKRSGRSALIDDQGLRRRPVPQGAGPQQLAKDLHPRDRDGRQERGDARLLSRCVRPAPADF